MSLSATQASEEAGVSVPTITRAIKSGKLSASKNPDGQGYKIDPAELFRVFPKAQALAKKNANQSTEELAAELARMEEKLSSAQDQVADLKAQREDWKAQAEDLKAQREDLKGDRDNWQKQADKLSLMLPSPEEQQPEVKKGFFSRIFGSK